MSNTVMLSIRNLKSGADCEENTLFSGSIAHDNFPGYSIHRNNNPIWLVIFLQAILEEHKETTTKALIHLSDILSTGTWVRQRDSVKQTKGKSDQMRR